MYRTEPEKGWISYGENVWRSTIIAVKRLKDQVLVWTGDKKRVMVATINDGRTVVATMRYHAATKLYTVRIEGFEFWNYNRILGYDHYSPVIGIASLAKAKKLVEETIKQAQAYSEE